MHCNEEVSENRIFHLMTTQGYCNVHGSSEEFAGYPARTLTVDPASDTTHNPALADRTHVVTRTQEEVE